ncbi:phosphate ABC transporter substrate-binding/OmpA family protein [Pseudomonas sp. 21LCFQ02]|uniref:substrate-binding domain-containing protein n=1 Tax=Pseudomonas sp. 21LCFQ02 TaxID=2957505 RepID=UPI00209A68AA|nr:phosphate ABC transporter substrate-binding/OmpA family protein [Pseudomonas sp. 21LCFQ02]MCO8168770.1 phosphate ABC transporter substrate-binding/OmpA family protein [Pseudomonas sp. 21LCFQ02]
MFRALLFALLLAGSMLSVAAQIAPDSPAPVLRLQGSNTINAQLGPRLIEGLMREQGLQQIQTRASAVTNEQRVTGQDVNASIWQAQVAAHGSSTGFKALQGGLTDVAASSRPIKHQELQALASLGDLRSQQAEHVIGIDGVAVIVHPGNPLRQLDTQTLARIFSGEISDWQTIGGTPGRIVLCARDEQSGTWETFRELVLTAHAKALSAGARRLESSEQLADEVSRTPNAIGFIGLPWVRRARALAIADGDAQPLLPTIESIATEDYPLTRRLYLYLPPHLQNPWAQALVRFAQSRQGQAIVAASGFVAQQIQTIQTRPDLQMSSQYQTLSRQAQRLSVNFRFEQGSARLDNKALFDVQRLVDYLSAHDKLDRQVTLVGFGDAKDDPQRALLLSRLRAMAVRRELLRHDVILRDVLGQGEDMPVADDDTAQGRIRNRRVEVWVH